MFHGTRCEQRDTAGTAGQEAPIKDEMQQTDASHWALGPSSAQNDDVTARCAKTKEILLEVMRPVLIGLGGGLAEPPEKQPVAPPDRVEGAGGQPAWPTLSGGKTK